MLSSLTQWLIETGLIAVLLYALAIGVAAGVVAGFGRVRRTLAVVEAGRHRGIDGLRGLLGVGVFLHHLLVYWGVVRTGAWLEPGSRVGVHLGETSVALFFMVTAFLFWGRVLEQRGRMAWGAFVFRRVVRLYPAYLLTVALVLGIALTVTWGRGPVALKPLASSLMQWVVFYRMGEFNGLAQTGLMVAQVLWSLQHEWLFYLALPVLAFVTGRDRRPVAAVAGATAIGAICGVFWWFGWGNPLRPWVVPAFLGGIAAAYWVRQPWLVELARTEGAGWVAVAFLVAVVGLSPTAYGWLPLAGLTVFFVVVASGQRFWGMLARPGLLWLGDITYPIYLMHGVLLWVAFRLVLPAPIGAVAFLAMGAGVAVVLVLWCSVVFLVVEHPAIEAGRQVLRRIGR